MQCKISICKINTVQTVLISSSVLMCRVTAAYITTNIYFVLDLCFHDNSNTQYKSLKTLTALFIKTSDPFCTFSPSFPSGTLPFMLFSFAHFATTLHTTQPFKCQGSRVKHMQHGLQFITQHLPDNFSLLTSLGKSYRLLCYV